MNILLAGLKAKHIQVALQANLSLWLYLMIKTYVYFSFQEADIACVT
jgi:hypothetical protein